jgi:outer membrane protein, heavy metal efflux system
MTRIALLVALVLATAPARAQTPSPAANAITLEQLEALALQNNSASTAAAAGILDRHGEHGFFVEPTIPPAGKPPLSGNALQRTVDQAEALRDPLRLRILSSVRQAYYAVLLTERRIEVEERLAALASEAVGVTAQLFNVGAADRPDYLEIEIESRRLQLHLNRSRNERFALRAQLAALTGTREVAERPLAGSIDAAIPNFERAQLIRTLWEQNPELGAARADLRRARTVTTRVNRNARAIAAAVADERRARAEVTRLELALQSRAASRFADYLTAFRAVEAYRSEILPRAEEAYRLCLSRYREMAAAYPQVLVAQRTLFEMSIEYLENLNEAWRAALQLQGFLAGNGLDAPAVAGAQGKTPSMGRRRAQ